MLWSLVKVIAFLAVVAALTVLAGMLSDQGGSLRIWAWGHEFTLGPLQTAIAAVLLVAAVWLGLRLARLLVATWRFLNGDETAISRHFDRSRERRGYEALSEGLIALAAGENVLALARARTAERLLHRPELTTLLTAQAATAAGDGQTATEAWKSLLGNESTRFVAVRGLMQQKLAEGDTATALQLAERALALKPRHAATQDTLLKLQLEGSDWKGARRTLAEKVRSGELPRNVYRRRDALLALQEAKVILDEGASDEAREAAIEAGRNSPDLIPAAAIAARALAAKGEGKAAARLLRKAWEARPHPDLAAAFGAIAPDESPAQRLKRFRSLFAANPGHEESRLTEAELLLSAEDFPGALRVLDRLPETHPTQRVLAILAAAERGSGAPDAEVRAILARALTAPRGPEWICDKCGATHEEWNPLCHRCGGFDTLSWREAAAAAQAPLRPDLAGLVLTPALPPRVGPDDAGGGDAEGGDAGPEDEPRPETRPTLPPDEILRRGD